MFPHLLRPYHIVVLFSHLIRRSARCLALPTCVCSQGIKVTRVQHTHTHTQTMDPLRQTDSAISVASRDQFFHDRKSNNVVSSEEEIHSPPPPLPLDSSTSASTPSSHKQLPQQPHEESRPTTTQTQPPPASSPTPNPTQPSAAPPPPPPPLAAAAAAGSSPSYPPATAISVTHRATMENLIAPLDVAQRHPPPLFVDRPDPSWYETQLRPPTPPKYDVDPAISSNPPTKKSTAESSSNNTTPPVSVGSTSTPGTSAASTSDATAAATFTSTTTTDDSAPLRSASRARSQSPFSPTGTSIPVTVSLEDPHEREAEERQEEEEESRRPTYAYHEAQDPEALDALAQAGSGAIVVDQEQLDLESDPGYESDRASFASTSLSSSVRDYLFENGRRYHRFREGRYNFPNDEPEQDREDMKHQCVKMLCQNQLFFAPIDDGGPLQNILDIGTGTGLWAIEMGDQFPSANVMGIDLSPIQPEWVPANVHFVVDDAESEWIYPDNHFDYIHTRHTVMAIKDWPRLYRTAQQYVCCRPPPPLSSSNSVALLTFVFCFFVFQIYASRWLDRIPRNMALPHLRQQHHGARQSHRPILGPHQRRAPTLGRRFPRVRGRQNRQDDARRRLSKCARTNIPRTHRHVGQTPQLENGGRVLAACAARGHPGDCVGPVDEGVWVDEGPGGGFFD